MADDPVVPTAFAEAWAIVVALVKAEAECTRLRAALEHVCSAFERDEAQGYRSKDRQFAITILRAALAASPTGATPHPEQE